MSKEWKIFAALITIFIVAYALPLGNPRIQEAIQEAFRLLQWYVRNHTLACVVPALFIAGAIITFLSQNSVMRYLGPKSNPVLAYAVASVAGCVLAVCSCSVLPMFAGIYNLGAGLGPATAFLYSGPDAIRFQIEEDLGDDKTGDKIELQKTEIADMQEQKTWVIAVHHVKWYLAGLMGLLVGLMAWRWFERDELSEWMHNTWEFAKLLVPLLFGGVFVVGFVSVLLPEKQVAQWVGDNSLRSNLVASVIGAFWYFATLTEIPITQALMNLGMHKGPVLALLLAGPALSLPNILVIRKVIGNSRTIVFILLVVVMSTIVGMFFGVFWG